MGLEVKGKYISLMFMSLKCPYPVSFIFLNGDLGFCGLPPAFQQPDLYGIRFLRELSSVAIHNNYDLHLYCVQYR